MTHYVNFLLGFAVGSTNEFPLADKARATNTAKYELAIDVWQMAASYGWDFDDSGNSGLPESDLNMVDNTQDVTLPTGTLEIDRIEVLDSNSIWNKLHPLEKANIDTSIEEYLKTKGIPRFYDLTKNTIKLYPPPASASVTLTAGLRVFFKKEIAEFTAATTTSEIGFDELGDRIVAHVVAYEFASNRTMRMANTLKLRGEELRAKFLSHMANRWRDLKPRIRIKRDYYE